MAYDPVRWQVETAIATAYAIAAEYRASPSGSHRAHLSGDSIPYPLRYVGAKVGAVLRSKNMSCAMVNVYMRGAEAHTAPVLETLMRGANASGVPFIAHGAKEALSPLFPDPDSQRANMAQVIYISVYQDVLRTRVTPTS